MNKNSNPRVAISVLERFIEAVRAAGAETVNVNDLERALDKAKAKHLG